MKILKKLVQAGFIAAAILPALWAVTPDALLILRAASGGPPKPYQGRMISLITSGKQSHSSDVAVYARPPNSYKRDFFSPSEELEKVVVSDGETEWIYFPMKKMAWKGDSKKTQPRILSDEDVWILLSKNYNIQLRGSDQIAGRDTWVVQILPRDEGKPKRAVWIDKDEPVILQSKEYHPDGSLATQSHFVKIEFLDDLPEELFRFDPKNMTVKEHGLDPDFLSMEELQKSGAGILRLPQKLPEGFIFESGNFFTFHGKEVTHLRYTDGLTVMSLFESSVPISSDDKTFNWKPFDLDRGTIGLSKAGKVIRWKSKGRYFALVGNLSAPALERVAKSLR